MTRINYTSTLLAAGFCERRTKACAMGLRWLRPAAFDYGKKLAANVASIYGVFERTQTKIETQYLKF